MNALHVARDPWVDDCRHCGATADQPCSPSCPSVDGLVVVDDLPPEPLTDLQPVCCPSPQAAARALCGCHGLGYLA